MNVPSSTNSAVSKAVADARPELAKPPEKPSHVASVGTDAVSKVARVGPMPNRIDVTA